MSELQKIVVLCVVFAAGLFLGMQIAPQEVNAPSVGQIDPTSLELETGPEDIDAEETEVPKNPIDPIPAPEPEMVACTMDAKMCPDGSFVGREGPNCEFAACPTAEQVVCTDEQKQSQMCTREYMPVCGLVEVQCVTEPCDPIPETFSNKCTACSQGNVVSYSVGACKL